MFSAAAAAAPSPPPEPEPPSSPPTIIWNEVPPDSFWDEPAPPPSPTPRKSKAGRRDAAAAATKSSASRTAVKSSHDDASAIGTPPPPSPSDGTVCVARVKGYWTFEVCVGREVLQFHQRSHGGGRVNVQSLGRRDASQAQAGIERFSGGSECSREQKRRSSVVTYRCGVTDRVIDVREPAPCTYELEVDLRSACTQAAMGVGGGR